jgi:hypothetical protein
VRTAGAPEQTIFCSAGSRTSILPSRRTRAVWCRTRDSVPATAPARVIMLALWIFLVRPDWVRSPADAYADQFVAAIEQLQPDQTATGVVARFKSWVAARPNPRSITTPRARHAMSTRRGANISLGCFPGHRRDIRQLNIITGGGVTLCLGRVRVLWKGTCSSAAEIARDAANSSFLFASGRKDSATRLHRYRRRPGSFIPLWQYPHWGTPTSIHACCNGWSS